MQQDSGLAVMGIYPIRQDGNSHVHKKEDYTPVHLLPLSPPNQRTPNAMTRERFTDKRIHVQLMQIKICEDSMDVLVAK